MRNRSLVAGLAAAALLCAPTTSDAGQWDQLIYAETSGTVELDPVRATDSNSWQLIELLFNGLMRVKPNLEPGTDLAKTYKVDKIKDKSGNEYVRITFNLDPKRGWAGQNVREKLNVNADDVVFTLNRVRNDKGASQVVKRAAAGIVRVRKVDNATVEVYYKPEDYRDDTIGNFAYIKIFSKKQWLSYLRRGRKRRLVFWGTGPYYIARSQGPGNVDLSSRRDLRKDQQPAIKMISREHRQDRRAAKQDLIIGNIDMMMDLTPLDIEEVTSDPDTVVKMKSFPSLSYTFIGYNHDHPLLGNLKFRQALQMGVDRETLRDDVFDNREEAARPITGPFDPILRGYKHDLEEIEMDEEEGRDALKSACALIAQEAKERGEKIPKGKKGGPPRCGPHAMELELAFNGESENQTRTADAFAKTLKENLGVHVRKRKLSKSDWLALQDRNQGRQFEMIVSTRVVPVNYDPFDTWHSAGLDNPWRYKNDAIDKILKKGRYAQAKQKPYIYQDFHEAIYNDQAAFFLWSKKPLAAINKRFTNIDENRVDVFRSIPSWGLAERP